MIHNIKIFSVLFLLLGAVGCFKDLDTKPIDPDLLVADKVYENPEAYKQVLAKLYAGLAVSGQQGPAGQSDIKDIDEGFGQYLRGYWYHQELTTDEAVIGWNDQTIKDFHAQTWTDGDGFMYAFYSRVFVQIALTNEYLRETTDAKLDDRKVAGSLRDQIKAYRAEARFLRALSYWHGLDLFRNTPFAKEDSFVGDIPKQTTANDLFAFIESELKAIEPDLNAPRTNEYGRADRGAAWTLLAKLYLNAEVYIGQKKYDDCLTYCDKIINAGYELDPVYQNVFLADNDKSKEIIFPVNFDGNFTRTWGGMTFIIRAGIGGSMDPDDSGVAGGWGGTRTTKEFVAKFPSDLTGIKVDYNEGATASYPKLYVPGSHQGFDATQTSNSLAAVVSSTKIYEGYKYFPNDNTEILFTQISSNTAPKFGDNGANGSLETGGANIIVPQKGLYYIKVNLANKTYILERQNWSIIGTATGGVEIPCEWDADKGVLVAAGQLAVGNFTFRGKNLSGVEVANLGDSDGNALLTSNGGDIAITQGGGHKVSIDLDKPDYTYRVELTSFDRRGLFYTDGQNIEIEDLTVFTEGYAIRKFKNLTSTGAKGKSPDFPDTDFPMFRLADVYLMASEAILRGAAGGNKDQAATYFNKVRERAFTGTSGNYTGANLTLDVMLDERGRELYWECQRRTDLVRFGQFTDGSYKWAWKGGVKEGAAVGKFRDIFPIPIKDLNVNPNMVQNPGY
jgi:hypothetical protein